MASFTKVNDFVVNLANATKYTKDAIDTGIATIGALSMAFANAQFYNDMLDSFKLHTTHKGE